MKRSGILILIFAAALMLAPSTQAREPFTLESVRNQVRSDYAGVSHLSSGALVEKLKREDVLLIDVREAPEFAVSHLAGAQRADPGIWRSTFMKTFGEKARGKTVVFYCSVGVRSSRLAQSVQAALKEQGARAVYNLDGGVFGWHNESRALVNASGATPFVHPFDSRWGKLVTRQELTRSRLP